MAFNAREPHKISKHLTADEFSKISDLSNAQNSTILCSAVVQLHETKGAWHTKWHKRSVGLMCFCRDYTKKSYFFRLFSFSDSNVWEQEMYHPFDFKKLTNKFYSFLIKECVVGLNFAFEDEAKEFCDQIDERIKRNKEKRESRESTNVSEAEITQMLAQLDYEANEENIEKVKQFLLKEKKATDLQKASSFNQKGKPIIKSATVNKTQIPSQKIKQTAFDLSKPPPAYKPPKPVKKVSEPKMQQNRINKTMNASTEVTVEKKNEVVVDENDEEEFENFSFRGYAKAASGALQKEDKNTRNTVSSYENNFATNSRSSYEENQKAASMKSLLTSELKASFQQNTAVQKPIPPSKQFASKLQNDEEIDYLAPKTQKETIEPTKANMNKSTLNLQRKKDDVVTRNENDDEEFENYSSRGNAKAASGAVLKEDISIRNHFSSYESKFATNMRNSGEENQAVQRPMPPPKPFANKIQNDEIVDYLAPKTQKETSEPTETNSNNIQMKKDEIKTTKFLNIQDEISRKLKERRKHIEGSSSDDN